MGLSVAPFSFSVAGTLYPWEENFLKATAKQTGKGEVELNSTIFFDGPNPREMNIKLGETDMRLLNGIVSDAVFVEILSGKVTDGDWRSRINKEEAWGEMDFKYQDLKIQLLYKVNVLPMKGKLVLLTFVADKITKNNNPRKLFNNQVSSTIYLELGKSNLIFGGWWRGTFRELKGSVGSGKPKIPKKNEEDSENLNFPNPPKLTLLKVSFAGHYFPRVIEEYKLRRLIDPNTN